MSAAQVYITLNTGANMPLMAFGTLMENLEVSIYKWAGCSVSCSNSVYMYNVQRLSDGIVVEFEWSAEPAHFG